VEGQDVQAEPQVEALASAPGTGLPQPNQARRATGGSALDLELEWLGRSGVELARYVLATESSSAFNQPDSLKQRWAGGPGDPNSPIASLPLENFALGHGTISAKIMDLDRWFNLNVADERILRQAFTEIGADASQMHALVDSILDWLDQDDAPRQNGAESEYYGLFTPPYFAKNGPVEDLSELLSVRGVTPSIYFGDPGNDTGTVSGVGLVDLFTPLSGRGINVNTASIAVLQLMPEIDENIAQAIVQARAGPDGRDGTDDDLPFRSPAELAGRVPWFGNVGGFFTVRSSAFEVSVVVSIEEFRREYVALLGRSNAGEIVVLRMRRIE
jgi:general secretion pathway protein K